MSSVLEPLLGILAIVVPLGVAYVILLFQARKPIDSCRKTSAITQNNPRHKMAELDRAE